MSELCGSEWYLNKAAIGKKKKSCIIKQRKENKHRTQVCSQKDGLRLSEPTFLQP